MTTNAKEPKMKTYYEELKDRLTADGMELLQREDGTWQIVPANDPTADGWLDEPTANQEEALDLYDASR
jgi:hypothetical protein